MSPCQFGKKSIADHPSKLLFPEGSTNLNLSERKAVMMTANDEMIKKCVEYGQETAAPSPQDDHIQAYACNVTSSGLLIKLNDATREGDGNKILSCWKYFLLHFKLANRTNYLEKHSFFYHRMLPSSPRMAAQLIWNRTISTHGHPGKNIPCDLHLEPKKQSRDEPSWAQISLTRQL